MHMHMHMHMCMHMHMPMIKIEYISLRRDDILLEIPLSTPF